VNDKTLEVDFSWTKSLANIERFKREINKRFHITSILGIGQKYPLINLNKSYQEAKTALTIARLMGQSDFIKHYKDLGVYRLLYMQDTETLKTFVDHTIHDLVEYDKYHDCELLKTLRVLFNSNMNWTTAAKTLYIHVNTLRYRISKINELLKVDINTLETQINLCIALKLMDSLKDNEFME
jgi:DNA-binding PucR family transcriptional regulator